MYHSLQENYVVERGLLAGELSLQKFTETTVSRTESRRYSHTIQNRQFAAYRVPGHIKTSIANSIELK